MSERRLMSRAEAAEYCGVSVWTWDKWVRKGDMPAKVIGCRWDRRAIDAALDRLSGISDASDDEAELIRRAEEWA